MPKATRWNVLVSLGAANRGVANATSANSSGAAADLLGYVNLGGRQMKGILNVGVVTSTGNLSVKYQQSTTTAEAGFADITGAVHTITGNSASLTGSEEIHFRANQRYVRAVGAAANTAQIEYATFIGAERRVV